MEKSFQTVRKNERTFRPLCGKVFVSSDARIHPGIANSKPNLGKDVIGKDVIEISSEEEDE